MGTRFKGISRTSRYGQLMSEIDSLLRAEGMRTVDLNVRKASGRVMADVYLAKVDSGIASSPDTSDLEIASSILKAFFEEHLGDQDFLLTLSSPGVGRELGSMHEFDVFRGRSVRVDYADGEGVLTSVIGTISSALGDFVELSSGGVKVAVPVDSIRSACLED